MLEIQKRSAMARRKDPLPGKRIKRERRGSSGAIFAPSAGRLPRRGCTPPFFARFHASLKKYFFAAQRRDPRPISPAGGGGKIPLPERCERGLPRGTVILRVKAEGNAPPGRGASGRGRVCRNGKAAPAKRGRGAPPKKGRGGGFPGKRGRFPERFFTCRRSRRCPWRS